MKRIESFWIPDKADKVWMISFELLNIASMGGLGNAVYNLSKALVNNGIDVTVIMPSHGRHLNDYYRSKLRLTELPIASIGNRKGSDGNTYPYKLGFEKGELDGIKIVLVKGLDYATGKVMDSWGIYDYTMEKSALLARAMESYVSNIQFNDIPSIIHVNDWHSVLAGVKAKFAFEERRIIVPLMYTVHLLNKVGAPWHFASEDWAGLENYDHYIWMVSRHVLYKTKTLWDICDGKVEKFGCYEADSVASVSKNYLTYDVFQFVGNMMENKSCVTYNGTDWTIQEVEDYARKNLGTINRKEIRSRLFSSLPNTRVIPDDYTSGNMLWNNRWRIGIRDDWTYEPLQDGPLVIFTGRIVYQKGIDLLLRAFRQVVNEIWNAKLVVLGIPAGDYGLLQDVIDRSAEIKDNVRLVVGKIDFNIYKLWHYASSVFTVPSRWEPFGINAIESMAVGTPVVASSLGGLAESIIDIRWSPEGTGFLSEPNSIDSLAKLLKNAIYLSLAEEYGDSNYLNKVDLVKVSDIKFWSKVRQNSINRVDANFRWNVVAKEALSCYEKSILMAKYRGLAFM